MAHVTDRRHVRLQTG